MYKEIKKTQKKEAKFLKNTQKFLNNYKESSKIFW